MLSDPATLDFDPSYMLTCKTAIGFHGHGSCIQKLHPSIEIPEEWSVCRNAGYAANPGVDLAISGS
jgi:hypothetical protein